MDGAKLEAANRNARFASDNAAARSRSVLAFAVRHGWAVKEHGGNGYVNDYALTKGDYRVGLVLDAGRSAGVARALTFNPGVCGMECRHPKRERLERFLIGIECCCVPDPKLYFYEDTPDPECLIHGSEQSEERT